MEIYTQSGIIRPQYSNAAPRSPLARQSTDPQDPDQGEQPGGGIAEAPENPSPSPAVSHDKTRREPASALDYAFFYAREYWWAVAIAAFLLGMWYKRKGA